MSNYNYNEIFCKPNQNLYPNMTEPSERMFDAYESGDLVAKPFVGSTAPWLYENCKNWTLNIPFNQGSCKELFHFNVIGDDPTTSSGGTVVMDYGSQMLRCDLLNFSPIGDISYLLAGCDRLETIYFNNTNVSLVNNLAYAFYNCSNWRGSNLSNWNISNVTNMAGLFSGCSQLQNSFLNISTWNTYKVNNFHSLFLGCSNLIFLDLTKWNVQNVTNLDSAFGWCSRLSSLNLAGWNIGLVNNLYIAISYCKNLTSLNVAGWNTKNVINYYGTFNYDLNLQTIDLTGWNLVNATNITRMFGYCNNLSNASLINIATVLLTATKITSKNLDNGNPYSPFNRSNKKLNAATIGSTLVSQLQANGWTL